MLLMSSMNKPYNIKNPRRNQKLVGALSTTYVIGELQKCAL
jgi:hypothetical protein